VTWAIQPPSSRAGPAAVVRTPSRSRLHRAVIPAVEEARKSECDRLDHLLERLADKIEAGDVKAITAAIRISESRSRLLGLNAPQRVDAVIQEPPAPPHIIELLDEARARVAV
jgi:hypothetical protein